MAKLEDLPVMVAAIIEDITEYALTTYGEFREDLFSATHVVSGRKVNFYYKEQLVARIVTNIDLTSNWVDRKVSGEVSIVPELLFVPSGAKVH